MTKTYKMHLIQICPFTELNLSQMEFINIDLTITITKFQELNWNSSTSIQSWTMILIIIERLTLMILIK